MWVSTRTPEGHDNVCPVCGSEVRMEPSNLNGYAPCPKCGNLLWFPLIRDLDEELVLHLEKGREIQEEATSLVKRFMLAKEKLRFLLDLRNQPNLSSQELESLLWLKQLLSSVKGKLRLRNVHPDLMEVFRITRLDQVFEILES